MRKEYELKKLRVKRRGPLPGFEPGSKRPAKMRITIALDQDLVEHFKAEASKPGGLPYQTQINQTLRRALEIDGDRESDPSAIKQTLLEDTEFLETLAAKLRAKPAA
ncbi:MAG: BrnA antitoxin family protein [Thermoanaerobaculia bacterium]